MTHPSEEELIAYREGEAAESAAIAEHATGLRIPTSGVESLNAASAAAILLYEAARQRGNSFERHAAGKS